jgi:diguanylate cyclase (GGDEF)-like protein/PAS domain S-box-containing protein
MKIRTQLLVSAVLAVACGIGAGLVVWLASVKVEAAEALQQRAQTAARETASLLVLTQEYASRFEERAEQQWQQRHQALVALLGENSGDESPAATLDGLRATNAVLAGVFARLAQLRDTPDSTLAVRRKEFLIDRMMAETQSLADGVYRWSREAAAARDQAEARVRGFGVAAFATMFLLLLAQVALVWRKVLRPMAQLERANAAIQRGEFGVQLRADSRDELGDLRRSFNAMAGALGERTQALDREMARREASEERIAASETRLRDITNNIPALIGYFDAGERCEFANDPALKIHGIAREDLASHTLRSALGEANYALHRPHLPQVLAGRRASFEGAVVLHGRTVHYQAHLVPDALPDGQVRGFYLMSFDITAQKSAEHERAAGEHRLRTITDNLPVLISYIDRDERMQFANATFTEWMGLDPTQMPGRRLVDVIGPVLHGQRVEHLHRGLAGERVTFEVVSQMGGVRRHLQNVYIPDVQPDGSVAGIYALSSDVTAMKRVEERLHRLARVDDLTGLPNRRQFEEKLAQALARHRREQRPMALLFLDVDRFKQINDQHGHGVGDEVLKEFALRLRASVRITDTVARLAGDEFVVVLEGLHAAGEAERVAQKIGQSLEPAFGPAAMGLSVRSSIGVAYVDGEASTPAELIERADQALYQAKRAGRGTYAVHRAPPAVPLRIAS